jgi:hypothetical protein
LISEQPKVNTYEDQFPKEAGPPFVANNTGKKLHDTTKPIYTVQLDSGAFMALWEHMEAETRHRFPTHSTFAHVRAYIRAVQSLRDAYWAQHGSQPSPPQRRLKRPQRA